MKKYLNNRLKVLLRVQILLICNLLMHKTQTHNLRPYKIKDTYYIVTLW